MCSSNIFSRREGQWRFPIFNSNFKLGSLFPRNRQQQQVVPTAHDDDEVESDIPASTLIESNSNGNDANTHEVTIPSYAGDVQFAAKLLAVLKSTPLNTPISHASDNNESDIVHRNHPNVPRLDITRTLQVNTHFFSSSDSNVDSPRYAQDRKFSVWSNESCFSGEYTSMSHVPSEDDSRLENALTQRSVPTTTFLATTTSQLSPAGTGSGSAAAAVNNTLQIVSDEPVYTNREI